MGENVFVVSGLPGTGSSSVAKKLAQKLHLKHFSPGDLFKGIGDGTYKDQFYAKDFLKICEENGLIIPKLTRGEKNLTISLWETDLGKSSLFHQSLDEFQQKLADQGNIVLEGKLSIHMIKRATMKFWLSAPLGTRAKRTAEREKLSEQEAVNNLLQRQKFEENEWKKIYGITYSDQEKKADHIIQAEEKSPDEIVELILEKISSTPPFVLGITGPICSGTTTLAEILEEKGFTSFSYSDELRNEAARLGIEITRKNLQDLGDKLRKEQGNGIISKLLLNKMRPAQKYVVANIRNPGEVGELRKNSNCFIVFVNATQEIRFARLLKRNRESDPQTLEEFKKLENRDLGHNQESHGQQHSEVFKLADFTLENNSSIEDLKSQSEILLNKLDVL